MTGPGRTVVLTGAAGSLGRALAERLAVEAGPRLVLCDVDAAVAFAVDRFGGVDVMINNAGVLAPNARMYHLTAADWDRQIRVNLMGVVHGMTAAVRVVRAGGGGGSIVNPASVAGLAAWRTRRRTAPPRRRSSWWVPTPTWPARSRGGPPAPRSSWTAATRRRDPGRRRPAPVPGRPW